MRPRRASRRVVLPKGLFRQTMFVWIKDGSIVCYHATSGRKIRMFLFVWRDYLTDLMDDHVLCQCHFFCTADSESSPSIQISRLRAASRVSERADFKALCQKPRLSTCKIPIAFCVLEHPFLFDWEQPPNGVFIF